MSRFHSFVLVPILLGFVSIGGCCAEAPDPVEECILDCHRVGLACNPDDLQGRFSATACMDICREENSRLVLFPDCFPCLADEVSCDVPRFFTECVPAHCWDPDVWNETGMAVPPPGR